MAVAASMKNLIDTAHIIESKGTHKYSIIWFHGIGNSSDTYKDIFTQIQPPNTRIVLPNAPQQWITIQDRQHYLRSWYEAEGTDIPKIFQLNEAINELIDGELKLVKDASHIIIGGFSQGGSVSLLVGLYYYKQQLGGIICCGSDVPFRDKISQLMGEYATKVPILVYHGKDDDRVKWDVTKSGLELLEKNGVKDNIQVVVEDGVGHTISEKGLHLIVMFITKQFKL
ncbi:unnamed protein product [Adineta steineri]|uniref:palmitoyl-protein hydrolase n=1 Tax=Adineta steineri TaxID=433720 RepID=A0A815CWY1_9BILA|nr:unnamed protein product [Adineta steineri]